VQDTLNVYAVVLNTEYDGPGDNIAIEIDENIAIKRASDCIRKQIEEYGEKFIKDLNPMAPERCKIIHKWDSEAGYRSVFIEKWKVKKAKEILEEEP